MVREYSRVDAVDPVVVWEHWTEPEHWPHDDPDIAAARINGPLAVGCLGWIRPVTGPRQTFKIVLVDVRGRRFQLRVRLPGARLRLERELTHGDNGLATVTHRVRLTGPLAPVWDAVLGRRLAAGMETAVGNIVAAASR